MAQHFDMEHVSMSPFRGDTNLRKWYLFSPPCKFLVVDHQSAY